MPARAAKNDRSTTERSATQRSTTDMNLVVMRGEVVNGVTLRELPSGGTVAQFDVATRVDAEAVNAAPVTMHDPSVRTLDDLEAGGSFVVVGRVRRRFFRVGGATQSRTEVVADVAIPTRRRAQVTRALEAAADGLDGRSAPGVRRPVGRPDRCATSG